MGLQTAHRGSNEEQPGRQRWPSKSAMLQSQHIPTANAVVELASACLCVSHLMPVQESLLLLDCLQQLLILLHDLLQQLLLLVLLVGIHAMSVVLHKQRLLLWEAAAAAAQCQLLPDHCCGCCQPPVPLCCCMHQGDDTTRLQAAMQLGCCYPSWLSAGSS